MRLFFWQDIGIERERRQIMSGAPKDAGTDEGRKRHSNYGENIDYAFE